MVIAGKLLIGIPASVRLEGSYNYDSVKLKKPRFAPFVAAGYLVAHSDLLKEVPFDPFLGYIFMGEGEYGTSFLPSLDRDPPTGNIL